MTLSNFDFKSFSRRRVLVFVSGPGYLEYPWALETAVRLKKYQAEVEFHDLSLLAHRYAMRLQIGPFRLPWWTRKLLRKLIFSRESRMENVVQCTLRSFGIPYYRVAPSISFSFVPYLRRSRTISQFKNTKWGEVPADEILRTVISNRNRRYSDNFTRVSRSQEKQVRIPICQTHDYCQALEKSGNRSLSSVFVANGRQPVQAAITTSFRALGKQVVTYESAGGYIFPDFLDLKLDYFYNSPHDVLEMQNKVSHFQSNLLGVVLEKARKTALLTLSRRATPFTLNYLPSKSSVQKNLKLPPIVGRKIVFFASSEWELSLLVKSNYLDIATNSSFNSQLRAVHALLEVMSADDHLIVRLHPSDPGKKSEAESFWSKLTLDKRITLINPNSDIDSYELAESADLNFIWMSFLGAELILKNLRVGILGPAAYAKLVNEIYLQNTSSLKSWIDNPITVSPDRLLAYFGYLTSGGFENELTRYQNRVSATICGKPVDEVRPSLSRIPEILRLSIS